MIAKLLALFAFMDAHRERQLRLRMQWEQHQSKLRDQQDRLGLNACRCKVCKDINNQTAYLTYDPRMWDHARFLIDMDNMSDQDLTNN